LSSYSIILRQNYVLLFLYKYAQNYEENKNLGEGYTGVCHTNGRWGWGQKENL